MNIDHDRVQAYLGDRLGEEDRDAFEIELLESEELQSAVIIERAIKRELSGLMTTAQKPPPAKQGTNNYLRAWAVAASLCLGLSLAFNLLQDPADLARVDEIIYVEPIRSSQTQSFAIDASKVTVLSVAVSDPRARQVAVSFSGASAGTTTELPVSSEGIVNVVVPRLGPGAYQLTLDSQFFTDTYDLAVIEQ